MPDTYVQLALRQYNLYRQSRGSHPVFEFHLQEHERLISIERSWTTNSNHRRTVDHHILIWVECLFPVQELA